MRVITTIEEYNVKVRNGSEPLNVTVSAPKKQRSEKNPWMAALLTLLFLPLGYLYTGDWKRGLIVLVFAIVAMILLTFVGAIIVQIIASYDVYKLSKNEKGPFNFVNQFEWVRS